MRCVPLFMLEALDGVISLPEVLEVMHRLLLCMLEVVESVCCVLELLEVYAVLPFMLEAVEGVLCLLDVLESSALCTTLYAGGRGDRTICAIGARVVLYTLEVLDGVRYVPLCILEDVEGVLWWLEELEVTRCVLLCMLSCWRQCAMCYRCRRSCSVCCKCLRFALC